LNNAKYFNIKIKSLLLPIFTQANPH